MPNKQVQNVSHSIQLSPENRQHRQVQGSSKSYNNRIIYCIIKGRIGRVTYQDACIAEHHKGWAAPVLHRLRTQFSAFFSPCQQTRKLAQAMTMLSAPLVHRKRTAHYGNLQHAVWHQSQHNHTNGIRRPGMSHEFGTAACTFQLMQTKRKQ